MLPPQTVTTRDWATRLGTAVPELSIVVAEDDDAALEIAMPRRSGPAGRSRRPGGPAPVAAGAAGRAARGLLFPGADRAPRRRHQFPRDLQRPHRRPHHGLRARIRSGAPGLSSATASPRVAPGAARHRGDPPPRGDAAARGRGWYRRRGGPSRRGIRHARDRRRRPPPRGAAGRGRAPWARRARRAVAACGLRGPHRPAYAGDGGLHEPRALSAHEAHGVLHQYRARHDHAPRRSRRRAAGRRDRRGRARRLRAGAAARRSPPVCTARPRDHVPHHRHRSVSYRRFDSLLDNCRRFLAGQPLRNVVDKPRWF